MVSPNMLAIMLALSRAIVAHWNTCLTKVLIFCKMVASTIFESKVKVKYTYYYSFVVEGYLVEWLIQIKVYTSLNIV